MNELYYGYLEGCRIFNELNALPEKGWEWHHTLPQCLFGDQPFGLWLTKEQHAIASVLQSYAFGTCCVTGWMKKDLPVKWVPHWKLWRRAGFLKIRFEGEGLVNWTGALIENNWNNDEVNRRRGRSVSERNKDPESQRNRSKAAKATQNKPEVKAKHAQVNQKPEVKERRSRAQQAVQKGLRWFVHRTGKRTKSRILPGPDWQPGCIWKSTP